MRIWRWRERRSPSQLLVALGIASVLLGACSSSTDGALVAAPAEVESKLGSDGLLGDGDEVDTQVLQEVVVPDVPGAPVNRFDLEVGDCFNEGSWFDEELDRRVDLTAQIECGEAHQSEVYFESVFPAAAGASFPGDDAMAEWSTRLCYDAFEPFVGVEYEVSSLEIGFVQPTRDTFEHPVGLHRRVFCYVFDVTGEEIVGSARGSGA